MLTNTPHTNRRTRLGRAPRGNCRAGPWSSMYRHVLMYWSRELPGLPVYHQTWYALPAFSHFSFINVYPTELPLTHGKKISANFSSSDVESPKRVLPAGRVQRGLPGAPPARPLHQPRAGRGSRSRDRFSLRRDRFRLLRNSARFGPSVLASDAASTYWYCTG